MRYRIDKKAKGSDKWEHPNGYELSRGTVDKAVELAKTLKVSAGEGEGATYRIVRNRDGEVMVAEV